MRCWTCQDEISGYDPALHAPICARCWEKRRRREDRYYQDVRKHIEEQGLTGLMNNTRWMRAVPAIQALGLRSRWKLVTDEEPGRWSDFCLGPPEPYVEHSGGPVLAFAIEWVEIDPTEWKRMPPMAAYCPIDRSEEVELALRSLRVPFSIEEGHFRIWGYVRPGGGPKGGFVT